MSESENELTLHKLRMFGHSAGLQHLSVAYCILKHLQERPQIRHERGAHTKRMMWTAVYDIDVRPFLEAGGIDEAERLWSEMTRTMERLAQWAYDHKIWGARPPRRNFAKWRPYGTLLARNVWPSLGEDCDVEFFARAAIVVCMPGDAVWRVREMMCAVPQPKPRAWCRQEPRRCPAPRDPTEPPTEAELDYWRRGF